MIGSSDGPQPHRHLGFAIVGAGTVLGLAGIDLVLPAIPQLPLALGTDKASAQLVLATFVAGMAAGLLLFGALAERASRRRLLLAGLAGFALSSLAGALSSEVAVLVAIRFLQGVFAAAPAVIAPGVIRSLFDEDGATRAIGLLGSVESLVPAGAPIAGAWLLGLGGWRAPFIVTAVLAALLALVVAKKGSAFPSSPSRATTGTYVALLGSPRFLRYAVSHALVLGGLLVFVFGAPAVIVHSLGGTLTDFIRMQVIGVACFIAAANVTAWLVQRQGAERIIMAGTALCALSSLSLLAYSLAGGQDPLIVAVLFAPMNLGLGLRGPPGFLAAVIAGDGDDERAASLTILFITAVTAGATALLAPFIHYGLTVLAGAVALVQAVAVGLLLVLPARQAAA